MGSGPDPDAFTLDRVGRGRLIGRRGGTVLERRNGDAWVAVERYPDQAAASRALDRAIAQGGSPTHYRLTTSENGGGQRLLLIGSAILAVFVVISLWQIIT